MGHSSYTTEALQDNGIVSMETGIKKEVLDIVDEKVDKSADGKLKCFNLTNDTVLVVCKGMKIGNETLSDPLHKFLKDTPNKRAYLVLVNCTVDFESLQGDITVPVLDLRGDTTFTGRLIGATYLDKVLLRNNTTQKQLALYGYRDVGKIYQLSKDDREMNTSRMFLHKCHLDGKFEFVNLNSCCAKLLTKWCIAGCSCSVGSRDTILKSFDPKSQPFKEDLKDI